MLEPSSPGVQSFLFKQTMLLWHVGFLQDILGEDLENKLYGTDQFFNQAANKIDELIKSLQNRPKPKRIKEAIRNFRKNKGLASVKMDNFDQDGSTSPVYLSQYEKQQIDEKQNEDKSPASPVYLSQVEKMAQDTSTPMTVNKGKYLFNSRKPKIISNHET